MHRLMLAFVCIQHKNIVVFFPLHMNLCFTGLKKKYELSENTWAKALGNGIFFFFNQKVSLFFLFLYKKTHFLSAYILM